MFLDGVGSVVETLELGRYPEAREGCSVRSVMVDKRRLERNCRLKVLEK